MTEILGPYVIFTSLLSATRFFWTNAVKTITFLLFTLIKTCIHM
jgi:hypothetical protein